MVTFIKGAAYIKSKDCCDICCPQCNGDFIQRAATHGLMKLMLKSIKMNRYVCFDCHIRFYQ